MTSTPYKLKNPKEKKNAINNEEPKDKAIIQITVPNPVDKMIFHAKEDYLHLFMNGVSHLALAKLYFIPWKTLGLKLIQAQHCPKLRLSYLWLRKCHKLQLLWKLILNKWVTPFFKPSCIHHLPSLHRRRLTLTMNQQQVLLSTQEAHQSWTLSVFMQTHITLRKQWFLLLHQRVP